MVEKQNEHSEEMLLDYLAGRCSDEDAARIRATAEQDADFAAELAVMQGARAAFALGDAEHAPGALGWARLEREIARESAASAPPMRRPVWQLSAVAAAALLAVAVWQFDALSGRQGETGGYVPATALETSGPSALIAFVPDATESQIRAILKETGARVTDGPSAIGLWRVSFETESDLNAALAQLRAATGVVSSVQVD